MSILLTSLFFWMEKINKNHFIVRNLITSVDVHDVELMISEAISYMNFLLSSTAFIDHNTMKSISTTNPLGLIVPIELLYLFKYTAITGTKIILRTIGSRIFSDILYEIHYGNLIGFSMDRTFTLPGFPDPVFGHVDFYCWPIPYDMHQILVDEEDRSLYVTFSRGFRVSKEDVACLFLFNFGDCVQYVDMPRNNDNNNNNNKKQSLFARVIMKSVTIIDMILGGKSTAKFKIRGKHVWAKKFKKIKV
ncbi:hypothetical protein vseg_005634 [Gypsophila vaccaria]